MKFVGVIGRYQVDKNGKNKWTLNDEIAKVISSYGYYPLLIVEPIEIANNNDLEKAINKISPYLKLCSGFILQGGSEITLFDKKVVSFIHKRNIPVLGICLGMQIMVEENNGIISTLSNKYINHLEDKMKYVHKNTINKNSKLYEFVNEEYIKVNSRHKDYVLKTNYNIVSLSDDNVIEAVEDKDKLFFIGVQWHPESMIEYDKVSNDLFKAFFLKVGWYYEHKSLKENYRC